MRIEFARQKSQNSTSIGFPRWSTDCGPRAFTHGSRLGNSGAAIVSKGGRAMRSSYHAPIDRSPSYGPAAGGTLIIVKGLNFGEAGAVHVGTAAASEVHVISSSELTARTPPGSAGTVDVTVATSATTSAVTTKDHFTYKA